MTNITDTCLPKLAETWSLLETAELGDPGERLARDEALLDSVSKGEQGPVIRIWRNHPCLVATIKESRMPNFGRASQQLAVEGWPVIVRRTGGACVPHGPGVVNLSLVYPEPEQQDWQLEHSYQLLCLPLQRLLASYGLTAETGFVEGSFCDGRYNLQVAGQKLVGTAQRWRRASRQDRGAILAHACLLTDLDLTAATEAINRLYQRCENPQQFVTHTCTTLRTLAGKTRLSQEDFVTEVINQLRRSSREIFNIAH